MSSQSDSSSHVSIPSERKYPNSRIVSLTLVAVENEGEESYRFTLGPKLEDENLTKKDFDSIYLLDRKFEGARRAVPFYRLQGKKYDSDGENDAESEENVKIRLEQFDPEDDEGPIDPSLITDLVQSAYITFWQTGHKRLNDKTVVGLEGRRWELKDALKTWANEVLGEHYESKAESERYNGRASELWSEMWTAWVYDDEKPALPAVPSDLTDDDKGTP